jgi:hypothetical protein
MGSMKSDLEGNKMKLTRKDGGKDSWELLMLKPKELIWKGHRGTRMVAKRKM